MSKNAMFERSRDELFSHINRCGVLKASSEQQVEWMNDTMEYVAERYPELSPEELEELRTIGLRFCQPVIGRGSATSAEAEEDAQDSANAESAAA